MGGSVRTMLASVSGLLVVGLHVTPAAAILTSRQVECRRTVAQESVRFLAGMLKLEQRCRDADLRWGSATCPLRSEGGPIAAGMARWRAQLVAKLRRKLDAHCDLGGASGFADRCVDPNPSDGFTVGDLEACLESVADRVLHGGCVGGANAGEACATVDDCPDVGPNAACVGTLSVEYDPGVIDRLTGQGARCQAALAHASGNFLILALKAAVRCVRETGTQPSRCWVEHAATARAVATAREKAHTRIAGQCRDGGVVIPLRACDPDQPTGEAAASCELTVHEGLATRFFASVVPDLSVCGDGRVDLPSEECDGPADAACPGACGAPSGSSPCRCGAADLQPRLRVIEKAADLDIGWTGTAHDAQIANGGGYLADLWDCDGPNGPDTVCNLGPWCSDPPHAPCSPGRDQFTTGDALCASFGQGHCRKTIAGATGPHCEREVQRRCRTSAECPLVGDRCVTTPHGPPTPISAAGISVCMVNTFSEDVVGTTDLATGQGAVRLRQLSEVYLGDDRGQPCPVCGGFCSGLGSVSTPGVRTLCASNDDCAVGAPCVTEPVCSFGRDVDQPCRRVSPIGGTTAFFGQPSSDCRMAGTAVGEIDLLFNPLTTGMTTLTADQPCARVGLDAKTCAGGPNEHAVCALDSECPGGTCNDRCFCRGGPQQPNACQPACVGGPDDAAPCVDDSACAPPGFCHASDCRLDPSDTGSTQEGVCTVGPTDGRCALHSFVPCHSDGQCRAPQCPFCAPEETCTVVLRQCLVDPTIVRSGVPGMPDRSSAAVFCVADTSSPAVNEGYGLPGPGAVTQSETLVTIVGAAEPGGTCTSNAQCAAADYCATPQGGCGASGTCAPRPGACVQLYDPVCGCDAQTYSNACVAAARGVNVASVGACS